MARFTYYLKMRRRSFLMNSFQGVLLLWALMCSPAAAADATVPAADPSASTTVTAPTTGGTTMSQSVASGTMVMNSTSMYNSTETPSPPWMLMCWKFHCYGAQCYQNQSTYMDSPMMHSMNSTMMPPMNSTGMPWMNSTQMNTTMMPPMRNMVNCPTGSYCELYRYDSMHFEARCSSQCTLGRNMCMVNGTMKDNCTMDCCNTTQCVKRNSTVYGDMPTTPATTTTTTTAPTTTPFPANGKTCRKFTCDTADCFKGKDTKEPCRIGYDYCELKKTFSGATFSYSAGCSNGCKTSTSIPSCSGATTGQCYQECCNATATNCCMMLDGNVHLNGATQLNRGSLIKLVICATMVILSSRLSAFQHI
ncbi:uncharacterized protein LOC144824172 [Lissotriton helveticus]